MKKQQVVSMLLGAAFILPAINVSAAESSVSAAVTSNYVFRGQTMSKDGVAVQGAYNIKQSKDDLGWYAGAFLSTVGKIGGDGFEGDGFGGWKGSFGQQSKMGYDVGGIFYKYTDNKLFKDTTEIYAGINYETAYLKLFSGSGPGVKNYTYIDLGASFVVMQDLDLDLHAGHLSSSNTNDLGARLKTKVKDYDLSLDLTVEDSNNNIEFFVTVGKSFDL